MLGTGQARQVSLALGLVAGDKDVVGAQRGVGGDDDAHRAVHARELFDGQHILDVSVARTAVFVGKNAAHQAQPAELLDDLQGIARGLIPLANVGSDLARGKVAHHGLQLPLLVAEFEVHAASPFA